MSRLLRTLLACLVIALFLPVAAVADQTDEARQLLDDAQSLIAESSQLDQKTGELLGSMGQLDPAKDRAKALSLLADAQAAFDEMNAKVMSVQALYDEAAGLDISDELKTYIAMQQDTAAAALEANAAASEMLAKTASLWGQWNDISQTKRDKLSTEIAGLVSDVQISYAAVGEKSDAAAQYYDDNNLGQELAGDSSAADEVNTGVLIGLGVGSVVIAVVFAFICGYLARRKGRSTALWAILGFLFPIIALIIIAVLSSKKVRPATEPAGPTPQAAVPEAPTAGAPEVAPPTTASPQEPTPSAASEEQVPAAAPEQPADSATPVSETPSSPDLDTAPGREPES